MQPFHYSKTVYSIYDQPVTALVSTNQLLPADYWNHNHPQVLLHQQQ